MTTTAMKPRVTSFAPQFLVDDLERSIAYYRKLGFTFGEPWDGFYAIGYLDGLELHLKEAPKNQAERRHRSVLRTVHRQRCNGPQASRGYCVGHERLLCRGSRRLHRLFRRPSGAR